MSVSAFIPLIDDNGRVWLPDPATAASDDPQAQRWHLYHGCRAATFQNPAIDGAMVVHIIGGADDDPDFVTDGVAIAITADGLRQMAQQFIAAADKVQRHPVGDA